MSDIFIKLLNMSLNASWLIFAVIVLRLLLNRAPKWCICLLWGLVAIRLVCPVSLESIFSLVPSNEIIPENIAFEAHPQIHSGISYVDTVVNPVVEQTFTPDIGDSVNPLQVVTAVAGVIWFIGMSCCLIYSIVSFIILKHRVSASKKIRERVYACDEVRSPFILGVIKPVIYVPSGMSDAILECVIAHENAHLKRGDHFWKPLGFMILSVYWFNPLCWAAYILLCRDIEYACDEKVIRDKDEEYAVSYSQALLDCGFQCKRIIVWPAAFCETNVKRRVKNVLNYKKPAFWIVITAIAACVLVSVFFLTDPISVRSNPNVVNDTDTSQGDDQYQGDSIIDRLIEVAYDPHATSWMDEGVTYAFDMGASGHRLGYLIAVYEGKQLNGLDSSTELTYCRSFAEKFAPDIIPYYDSSLITHDSHGRLNVVVTTDRCKVILTPEKGISVAVTILPLDDETSESFPVLITSKP